MKNKISIIFYVLFGIVQVGQTQGFINLNFENATITAITNPGGNSYTATIPGWTVNTFNYVNGDPNSVPYNNVSLGAASVSLQGTNSSSPLIRAIHGQYSVLLQGEYNPFNVPGFTNSASISQTALLPASAQSLFFWGNGVVNLNVTINSQLVPYWAIGSGANYTIYGADISAFAGQTGQLSFTTFVNDYAVLDNIQFSSAPIPEPNTLALVVSGSGLLGCRRWQKISKT